MSPAFFAFCGFRRAAAVSAIASSINLRCASAVLAICSSFLSSLPFTRALSWPSSTLDTDCREPERASAGLYEITVGVLNEYV